MTQEELTDHLRVALAHSNFNDAATWIKKGANINDCYFFLL